MQRTPRLRLGTMPDVRDAGSLMLDVNLMLRIRTKMPYDTALQAAAELVTRIDPAKGAVRDNTFCLRVAIPRAQVTLRGRICSDPEGTLVCAWPATPWAPILFFSIWI